MNKSFIKITPDKETFNDFLNIHQFLKLNGIKVPEILSYDKKKLSIIQECVGDQLDEFVGRKGFNKQTVEIYKKAIDFLIEMQSKRDPACRAFEREFSLDKILGEYDKFVEPYFLNTLFPNLTKKQKNKFKKFYQKVARALAKSPKVFCHRDFQSTNLMLNKNLDLVVIDFQGARLALPQYDLVSLLEDNYLTIPTKIKNELTQYYINNYQKRLNVEVNKKDFKRLYNYTLIQRKLHDLAIFVRFNEGYKNNKFLKYIPDNLVILNKALKAAGFREEFLIS